MTTLNALQPLLSRPFEGTPPVSLNAAVRAQATPQFAQTVSEQPVHGNRLSQALRASRLGSLNFSGQPPYKGPYEEVKLLTDYGVGRTEETSNTEIKNRFTRVLNFVTQQRQDKNKLFFETYPLSEWTKKKYTAGNLPFTSISDIPGANVDFASLSLTRLGAAEPNQEIYIHVVDPGVGFSKPTQHDRSILVSQSHGIYIGPNNGSLGILYERLKRNGDTPVLYQIDFTKVRDLERLRLNKPGYVIPASIHGRDVFAVVAGAIASGIKPDAFAVREEGKIKVLQPVMRPCLTQVALPSKVNQVVTVIALRDKTFANLKLLNVALTQNDFNQLRRGTTSFEVRAAGTAKWHQVAVGDKFSDVKQGELVLYLGSSPGIVPDTRLVEIAINLGRAGDYFNVTELKAEPLEIRMVNKKTAIRTDKSVTNRNVPATV